MMDAARQKLIEKGEGTEHIHLPSGRDARPYSRGLLRISDWGEGWWFRLEISSQTDSGHSAQV